MEENIMNILSQLLEGQKELSIGIKRLDTRLEKVEARLENVEARLDIMEIQQKENTQILRSLLHSSEINKAEHESMAYNIAEIQGNIEAIKKDLSRVEINTAQNWTDIAILKAARQG